MELKCSECGGRVLHVVLTSYPSIDSYECQQCGAKKQDRNESELIPTIIDMD